MKKYSGSLWGLCHRAAIRNKFCLSGAPPWRDDCQQCTKEGIMKTNPNDLETHKTIELNLTTYEKLLLFSPLRLIIALALCAFVAEYSVHLLFTRMSGLSPEAETLLDSSLLSSVLCLFFIFLLYRPLKHLIDRYQINENLLQYHKENLEREVKTRTAELDSAFQKLRKEISEKDRLKVDHQTLFCTLHNTLTSMNEALVSLDRQWRYTYVNGAAERILGKGADELLGKICWEIFPESTKTAAFTEIRRCMEENRSVSFENYVPEPRNSWYENRCYPSPDGVTVFFTDITERKCTEEKYRELSDYFETTREQERLALSREIHDEIGQSLTALKLDISWIEHKFLPVSSDLTGRMNAMRSTLDTLIAKTQNISSELRPPLLDSLGLSAAIDWQAREFRRRCSVECHLMLNESVIMPDKNSGTVIMRILQEALTNIARHSGASEVSISLCRGNSDDIVLEISDNGCGITRERIDSPLSFGLMSMHERARLCHGTLSIRGIQGEGTTIRLEIPHRVKEETH